MKNKILLYTIGALITLFIGSQIYNTYTINSLKSKISDIYDNQIDNLKTQVVNLQTKKDSLQSKVVANEKIIDSLEVYGIQLITKRNTNESYYNKKIANVNTSSNDSIRMFLSNYKYSAEASKGNN
jgi:hypothetical protein